MPMGSSLVPVELSHSHMALISCCMKMVAFRIEAGCSGCSDSKMDWIPDERLDDATHLPEVLVVQKVIKEHHSADP